MSAPATERSTSTLNEWEENSPQFLENVKRARAVIGCLELDSSKEARIIEDVRWPDQVDEKHLEVKIQGRKTELYSCRIKHSGVKPEGFQGVWNRTPKGGWRLHQLLNLFVAAFLAQDMDLKAALFGLSELGGGKGGGRIDPAGLGDDDLYAIVYAFVEAFVDVIGPGVDVLAPDVNTNPDIMRMFVRAYAEVTETWTPGVVTGKPLDIGGQPGRIPATGFGAAVVAMLEAERLGLPTDRNCRVAIHGYGNVGRYMAETLERLYRCTIVAVCDAYGGYYNPKGLSTAALETEQREYGSFAEAHTGFGDHITPAELLGLPNLTILAPASIDNVMDEEEIESADAELLVRAANNPVTPKGILAADKRGLPMTPDYYTNGGGLFVSWIEMLRDQGRRRLTEQQALDALRHELRLLHRRISAMMSRHALSFDDACMAVALENKAYPREHHLAAA